MKRKLLVLLLISGCFISEISAQWTEKTITLSNYWGVDLMEFPSDNIGYILAFDGSFENFIAKTSNSGDSWTVIYNTIKDIEWFDVISNNTVYAAGINATNDKVLIKTSDGGTNWSTVNFPSIYPEKIQFLDENIGYVASTTEIKKTSDGGVNWSPVNLPAVTYQIYDFEFVNESIGYILYYSFSPSKSYLYKTTDSGNNWSMVLTVSKDLRNVSFFNENIGVAFGEGDVYYTNNSTSWNPSNVSQGSTIKDVKMVTDKIGFIADLSYVLKTTDGGQNFYVSKAVDWTIFPENISFPSQNIGYIAGTGPKFLRTTNAGGVGIEEVQSPSYFIYPNPASDKITVTFDPAMASGDLRVDVINILGQKVLTEDVKSYTGRFDLNIPNLSEGTYILNITNDHRTVSTKISIK